VNVFLGGVVVIVFAIGPKVRGLKPGKDDGFLRAIEIRNTTLFGGKQSRRSNVVRFYSLLKIPTKYEKMLDKQNSLPFSLSFS
jgi:hypothetical protein